MHKKAVKIAPGVAKRGVAKCFDVLMSVSTLLTRDDQRGRYGGG